MIVFDIETGPLAEETVLQFARPYTPPQPLPPFDARAVKVGNLGPEKAEEKIAAAAMLHADASIVRLEEIKAGEAAWRKDAMDRAALSPLTGQVLAIGYQQDTGPPVLDVVGNGNGFEEPMLLERFWIRVKQFAKTDETLVGHNILGFDLPFLIRRSWLLGVDVFPGIFQGRYFNERLFSDTMRLWGCGNNRDFVSLDTLARAFGVGGKPEGIDGGMFADLLKTDREAAKAYLRNDLDMTAMVAERMGVL